MDNSPPRSAVIYARVSSENDRQDTTRQITDLQGYAARENITIKKVFTEHISGVKKIEERAVLSECLDYCCSQGVEILLLSEISRLGRSTLQVLRSLERLHDAKVSVFIQNLGIYSLQADGTVNPLASIIITVLAEFSNIERSNIQYRLNSGRAHYVANGGKLGRKEGYRKSDEEMRGQYKTAIALLKKGYSVRAVAKLEGLSHTTVQKLKNKFI
jgi:DNA invertase Pin-like site-specific DNA recombinase